VAFLPDDPAVRQRCYRSALRNWKASGYVQFKELAQQWLLTEFVEYSLREIRQMLHEYVDQGGTVDEQVEKRPEYADYEFHYDLRVNIGGRRIYFETILQCDDAEHPDGSTIIVVSVHDV
jgi:hypothetical protein